MGHNAQSVIFLATIATCCMGVSKHIFHHITKLIKMAEIPDIVIKRLVFFTAAMIIAPLSVFFLLQQGLGASSVISGGAAALIANVVLIGYIVVAFMETTPSEDNAEQEKESKKNR